MCSLELPAKKGKKERAETESAGVRSTSRWYLAGPLDHLSQWRRPPTPFIVMVELSRSWTY